MPTRTLFALALLLALSVTPPAEAEPTLANATLTYAIGVGWSFDTGATSGRVLIDRSTSRKLTKLYPFTAHACAITYDPDSRIDAANGTFYALLRISKCN